MRRRRQTTRTDHNRVDRIRQKKRRRIFLWLIVIMVSGLTVSLLLFGLFHERFNIDQYTVSGLVHIKREDIIERIEQYFNDTSRYVSGKNYFMIKASNIEKLLSQSFAFKTVSVEKRYPDELRIAVEERVSATIYSDGSAYAYVSPDGTAIQKLRLVHEDEWISPKGLTASHNPIDLTHQEYEERRFVPDIRIIQAEFGDMPILIWPHGGALRPSWVDHTTAWYKELALRKMPIRYIEITDRVGDAQIHLQNDTYTILINLDKNPKDQFQALTTVLENEQLPMDIDYIDLRFDGIVYWK